MPAEFFAIVHCRARHGIRIAKNEPRDLRPMGTWINSQLVPCTKIMRVAHPKREPAPVAGYRTPEIIKQHRCYDHERG